MAIIFPNTTGSYEKDLEAGRQAFFDAFDALSETSKQPLIHLLNNMANVSLGHRVGFNTALVERLCDLA